jgi:hypothetical protein
MGPAAASREIRAVAATDDHIAAAAGGGGGGGRRRRRGGGHPRRQSGSSPAGGVADPVANQPAIPWARRQMSQKATNTTHAAPSGRSAAAPSAATHSPTARRNLRGAGGGRLRAGAAAGRAREAAAGCERAGRRPGARGLGGRVRCARAGRVPGERGRAGRLLLPRSGSGSGMAFQPRVALCCRFIGRCSGRDP